MHTVDKNRNNHGSISVLSKSGRLKISTRQKSCEICRTERTFDAGSFASNFSSEL